MGEMINVGLIKLNPKGVKRELLGGQYIITFLTGFSENSSQAPSQVYRLISNLYSVRYLTLGIIVFL